MAAKVGVLRARDVGAAGLPRMALSRLVAGGQLVRAGRGLYVLPGYKGLTRHHSLVEASKRVPGGTVCLLSALSFHGLGTQSPPEVWMAINGKARLPKVDAPAIQFVRFSGSALTAGVEGRTIEGVRVAIYSAAKTVADTFKYRNKLGQDVAIEALREYLRRQDRDLEELRTHAKTCRVERVMQPYVEALA
jgi:predicted transcriptional regulator of viral defense system